MSAVTLDSLKAHCNVTIDDDDALLTDKLSAAEAWVASYTGGPTGNSDTPAPINEAVLQLAAHLYANREAALIGMTSEALPMGFIDLLAPYRAWSF